MNNSQIVSIVLTFFYAFLRFTLVISTYISNHGWIDDVKYTHHTRGSKIVVSWVEEFQVDIFLLTVCLVFVIYSFLPNWLTYIIVLKNKYKNKIDIKTYIEIERKIRDFNEFHKEYDFTFLANSLTLDLFIYYTKIVSLWLSSGLNKVINVSEYKMIRILDYDKVKNEIWVISFERRLDFLKFKNKPLARQETSTTWDYVQYQFIIEEDQWKINYYEKDPSDMELFSYLLK